VASFPGGRRPQSAKGAILNLNLWFRSALLEDGWARDVRFRIADGRIAAIDRGVQAAAGEESHVVALAGMPNVHSHAFQRAMAGLTEIAGPGADSFWTWRELMYRFLERLEPQEIEAVTAFAFMEMLEGGFTRVGEFHYLHHDQKGAAYADPAELTHRVVAASKQSDIALTLLPVLYAHSNFDGRSPTPAQRRFINDIDSFARLVEASRAAVVSLDAARVGVAPHSLRAVTPEELRAATALVPNGPIHIHAAEQIKEVDDCVAWSGNRPVEWLLANAGVDRRWSLIHATQMTADETARLAASGAVAGLCPLTEANLGDGIFPAMPYLDAKGRIGIGTDSNILIDMAAELRMLEYSQRLALRRRSVLAGGQGKSTGRRLFTEALSGGARSLGVDESEAGLKIGAPADIVSLDVGHESLASREGDAWIDGWLFAARERVVDCVWRHGRKVVAGGVHVRREPIARRYRETLDRLLR
jgi:formiminoglutamate deiminase